MTNLFYIMGKSATGKDTIYNKLLEKIDLKTYIPYTTRPIRSGEKNGRDYYFITAQDIKKFKQEGKVIESRTYQTAHGPWIYATINDEQLKQEGDILTVGTLESYIQIREYFKEKENKTVLPIYITIDEKERIKRALAREEKQENPKYKEMERRLKADNIDFSEDNLRIAEITKKETFYNYNLEKCTNEILKYMKEEKAREEKTNINKTKNIDEEER